MKTLVYDNECPLCVAYTGAFVQAGLLEKEGRKNFNEVDAALLSNADSGRMHNEIPLIEHETGKVWYGIDALLEVLGTRLPLVRKIGHLTPVNWLLRKLYKLISYNRKVIVAVQARDYDCSPAFNEKYRIVFLLLGLAFNSFIFTGSFALVNKTIFPAGSSHQLQLAHYTVVAVNITVAFFLGKQKGLEYLGQVNMLAITAMLLLLPLIWMQHLLPATLLSAGIGFIAAFVTREYFRRMRYSHILQNYKMVVALNISSAVATFIYLY